MGLTSEQRDLIRTEISRRAKEANRGPAPRAPAMLTDLRLVQALARLSEDEREAWFDRIVIGDYLPRIGERMGCSRERVRELEKNAERRKLARLLPRDHPMVVDHLGHREAA